MMAQFTVTIHSPEGSIPLVVRMLHLAQSWFTGTPVSFTYQREPDDE